MKLNTVIKFSILAIGLSLSFAQIAFSEPSTQQAEAGAQIMTIYKTPTCGCCKKWVSHVEDNHFATKVVEMDDLSPIKTQYRIKGRYRSCHTGVVVNEVGEYIFEGHVPAEYVELFLSNPPDGAIGLSVPGMPVGSPGMEVGDRKDYYQVLLLNQDGSSSVFAHVNQAG